MEQSAQIKFYALAGLVQALLEGDTMLGIKRSEGESQVIYSVGRNFNPNLVVLSKSFFVHINSA